MKWNSKIGGDAQKIDKTCWIKHKYTKMWLMRVYKTQHINLKLHKSRFCEKIDMINTCQSLRNEHDLNTWLYVKANLKHAVN